MAYFECIIGSGGGGGGTSATITVSYTSTFYNKTMTCTKGSTTYTQTTTSSGSTVFTVEETGTWTITCDGVSRTVDVALDYTTQMSITQTVTVYGPASDTISFTDATGAKTVTTNANGQGSVAISFIPPSASITFTSSVAENPSNLSANYSKSITISSGTTEIYVMPTDNTLYWYGYKSSNFEDCTSANGWSPYSGMSWVNPTHSTNKITITADNTHNCGVGTKAAVSLSNLHIIYKGTVVGAGSYYGWYNYGAAKSWAGTQITLPSSVLAYESPSISGTYYLSLIDTGGRAMEVYAMWYT